MGIEVDLLRKGRKRLRQSPAALGIEVDGNLLTRNKERPFVGGNQVLLACRDIIDRLPLSLLVRVNDLLSNIVRPVFVMELGHSVVDSLEEDGCGDRERAQGVEVGHMPVLLAKANAMLRMSGVVVPGLSITEDSRSHVDWYSQLIVDRACESLWLWS